MGCPIRKSSDQSLLAAPRSLSQRATSFIASQCQGIHQMPFSRSIAKPSCTGSKTLIQPHDTTLSREDTPTEVILSMTAKDGIPEPLVSVFLRELKTSQCKRAKRDGAKHQVSLNCFMDPTAAQERSLNRQATRWWSQTGSNRRPHACKARALPTELWPLLGEPQAPAATSVALACAPLKLRGASMALEVHAFACGEWWARADSNCRPHAYQACALTT